jgi:diacylglycerol kinase (ATP)
MVVAEKGGTGQAVRVAYVLNPAAGGAARAGPAALRAAATANGLAGDILCTVGPGHASTLARQAAAGGAAVVVAVGGDGTAAEVAAGLLGTGAALAVLPTGTGNDLARQLGLPPTWRRALAALPAARRRPMDIGRANGQLFLQSAGVGLDAHVAALRSRERRFSGRAAYVKCAIQGLLTKGAEEVTLELDGRRWSQRALNVTVANGETYGGGLRIAPGASHQDGVFDVAIFGNLGRLNALCAFAALYRGVHVRFPWFRRLRGQHLTVTARRPLPIHADGNLVGVSPAVFTLEALALDVMSIAAGG